MRAIENRHLKIIIAFMVGVIVTMTFAMIMNSPISVKADDNFDRFEDFQDQFRSVAAFALPSVVEIHVVGSEETPETIPWEDFFDLEDQNTPLPSYALGSGVIIQKEENVYYVITNNHVVGDAEEMVIKLYDDRVFDAFLVGQDERKDLAIISFETDEEDIKLATIGDSDDLEVGEWVLAIGSPEGHSSTVTAGIISALGRMNGPDRNISDFIQTDAAINHGNSGGALVNMKGEVIGINSWITTSTGGNMGLGFSLPINNGLKTISDLITYGELKYGWLGVSVGDPDAAISSELGINWGEGAFLYQLFTSSPAEQGGLRPGDFIVSFNGQKVNRSSELIYLIGDVGPDTTVTFGVIRDGRELDIDVTLAQRDSENRVNSVNDLAWPGVTAVPLNDALRETFGLGDYSGILIDEVVPKTAMQLSGLAVGDLIVKINGNEVNNLKDFYRYFGNYSTSVDTEYTLEVLRFNNQEPETLVLSVIKEQSK